MLTFKHSGDIGDILYFMPVMRALGGGTLFIEAVSYTRVMLTQDKWCGIDLLLKQQPYVNDVLSWNKQPVNYNGNDFRPRLISAVRKGQGKEKHLGHWMCDAHGIDYKAMDAAWLTVEPNRIAPVVISRSGVGRAAHYVYHNPRFPWHKVWKKYGKDAVFVGTEDEHRVFWATCGEIPHYPTADLEKAARVIAGADLFIGNQSAPHAIAEGLKQRILLEVWPGGANCLVFRPGVHHGWDENVELPDI